VAARGKVDGLVKLYVEDEVEVEVRQYSAGTRLLDVHVRTARIFLRDVWWLARRDSSS
jgi:hypothetical protein